MENHWHYNEIIAFEIYVVFRIASSSHTLSAEILGRKDMFVFWPIPFPFEKKHWTFSHNKTTFFSTMSSMLTFWAFSRQLIVRITDWIVFDIASPVVVTAQSETKRIFLRLGTFLVFKVLSKPFSYIPRISHWLKWAYQQSFRIHFSSLENPHIWEIWTVLSWIWNTILS